MDAPSAYVNQNVSDYLETKREEGINYFGGRRLRYSSQEEVEDDLHRDCRALTLELRERYVHPFNLIDDTSDCDSALSVYVAGAWRHIIDHRTFDTRVIEYECCNRVALVPIHDIVRNTTEGLKVQLVGFGQKLFTIPCEVMEKYEELHEEAPFIIEMDCIYLKDGEVIVDICKQGDINSLNKC